MPSEKHKSPQTQPLEKVPFSFKKLVHKPSSLTTANTAVILLWALLVRVQAPAQLPGGLGHTLTFCITASKLDAEHLPEMLPWSPGRVCS